MEQETDTRVYIPKKKYYDMAIENEKMNILKETIKDKIIKMKKNGDKEVDVLNKIIEEQYTELSISYTMADEKDLEIRMLKKKLQEHAEDKYAIIIKAQNLLDKKDEIIRNLQNSNNIIKKPCETVQRLKKLSENLNTLHPC